MMRTFSKTMAAAVLLLVAGAAAAQDQEYAATYEIRFLGPHAAQTLAWDQCPKDQKVHCRTQVSTKTEGERSITVLTVQADRGIQEKVARALAVHDIGPKTQTFYVVLLAASPKPSSTPADLSPGARKALQDIQGFLPYRGYQVLDTALLRGTRSLTGRLVGRDNQGYDLEIYFQQPGGPDSKSLYVNGLSFTEDRSVPIPVTSADGKPAGSRPGRRLINSSFTITEGETLVVGTSRIDNTDEALILLLTASPPAP